MAPSVSSATSSRREGDGNGNGGDVPTVELRASVLEAAVSLGFRNSVMKKWMFDAVPEGEDDELAEHSTPALTSPSTSEESSMSPYSFLHPGQSSYPYSRQAPGTANSGSSPGGGKPNSASGLGLTDPLFVNPNVRFPREDGMTSSPNGTYKGPFGKLALAVPPPKNKLRKQKSAFVVPGVGGTNGYESDGGYMSEVSKKSKTKKGLGTWRRKDKGGDLDDVDSDGGYRSEAVSSSRARAKDKAKRKAREGEGNSFRPTDTPTPEPRLPLMSLDEDPGSFLATVKASMLNQSSKSDAVSASGTEPPPGAVASSGPGPASSSGHGHGAGVAAPVTTDGYLTDTTASSEKRGRTKKKTNKSKGSRPGSPREDGDHDREPRAPKKKSLFRLMGRSVSRDAKDRDRGKAGEEAVPPMPEPPKPPMPLPIAERFARSGAGTPVGNGPASSSPLILRPSEDLSLGLSRDGTSLMKSASSMDLPMRSSGSLSTLVPPTLRDPDGRSESPWSYHSAPGRIGVSGETTARGSGSGSGGSGSGSNSLEIPREMRDGSGGKWSPFVVIPRSPQSERNVGGASGLYTGAGRDSGDREVPNERPGSPSRSKSKSLSPIVTGKSRLSAPGSPDLGRSPTSRIGKLFNAFSGQSSKSDDGHYSGGSGSVSSNSTNSHPLSTRFSASATSSTSASSLSTKPLISHPNPQSTGLSSRFPTPMELAAALTASAKAANGTEKDKGKNLAVAVDEAASGSKTPESFMIISEDEGVPTPLKQQRFVESGVNGTDPSESSPYLSVSTAYANGVGNGSGGASPLGGASPQPASPIHPNGSSSGLSTRRRALLNGLGLDITPTQSRSGTPTPLNTNVNVTGDDPNEAEVRATRASVMAFYQVPPPSPPPTGPLPAPPPVSSSSTSLASPSMIRPSSPSVNGNSSRQMLSPGRAYASRSPSPLSVGAGARYSRSPSPGLGMGQGQNVRRGRESPFPTRPVLPPQNRHGIVGRVDRYKTLHVPASDDRSGFVEDDFENISYQYQNGRERASEEVVDRHSSAYIREARARGEKRVYFDTRRYSIRGESYADYEYNYEDGFDHGDVDVDVDADEDGDGYETRRNGSVNDVDPIIPNIKVKGEDASLYDGVEEDDFDEEADERLRLSKLSMVPPSPLQKVKDEFEDDEDHMQIISKAEAENGIVGVGVGVGVGVPERNSEGDGDEASSTYRRSYAASSVYSQYSVLDADNSARLREGLVRRVAALYNTNSNGGDGVGGGRLLREEIPDVPRLPEEFRSPAGGGSGGGGGVAAGQLGVGRGGGAGARGRNEFRMTSSPYRF